MMTHIIDELKRLHTAGFNEQSSILMILANELKQIKEVLNEFSNRK